MSNEGLWKQVVELDGRQSARRAGCEYTGDPPEYLIRLLNREYRVELTHQQITQVEDSSKAGFAEELCILAYLLNSRDIALSGRLTKAESLPNGQFFFRGPHPLPTEKLSAAFGHNPELLLKIAGMFDAKKNDFGDASIRLTVLPRLPLTIVVWGGDEEFAARSSILFDETAAEQMPLDGLWMATKVTAKALVEAVESAG